MSHARAPLGIVLSGQTANESLAPNGLSGYP